MKSYFIKSSLGVTLVEIMVVLTILVLVLSVGFPRIQNSNRALKSKVREFVLLAKQIRSRAQLRGVVHRLVIDFGPKEAKKKNQYYWVETGSDADLLADQSFLEKIEKEKEEADLESDQTTEEKKQEEQEFTLTESLLKEPVKLPKDLKFQSLELTHQSEKLSGGKAYIYFFPSGLIEEALLQIHLKESLKWTVFFHPYTGRVELIKKELNLKDLADE